MDLAELATEPTGQMEASRLEVAKTEEELVAPALPEDAAPAMRASGEQNVHVEEVPGALVADGEGDAANWKSAVADESVVAAASLTHALEEVAEGMETTCGLCDEELKCLEHMHVGRGQDALEHDAACHRGPISLPRSATRAACFPLARWRADRARSGKRVACGAVRPERGLHQRSDSDASAAFCGRHSLVPFARSSTGLFVGQRHVHGHAAGVLHGHFSRPRWKHLAQGTVCAVERPVEDKEPVLGCRNGQHWARQVPSHGAASASNEEGPQSQPFFCSGRCQ